MTQQEPARQAPPTLRARIEALRQYRQRLEQGGGPDRIARQHQAGKLTARERIHLLIEPETFQELFLFARHRCTAFGMADKEMPAEGVITGCGSVDGRQVFVAAQDFTVAGGSVARCMPIRSVRRWISPSNAVRRSSPSTIAAVLASRRALMPSVAMVASSTATSCSPG